MTDNDWTAALMQSFDYNLRSQRRSESLVRQYKTAFGRFYHWLGEPVEEGALKDVTKRLVERHIAELLNMDGSRPRPATLRYHFAGLQGFWKWYAAMEDIADPMFGMRGPSVPEVQKDVVPIDETRKLLLGLDRRKAYRDAALISVLAETGMRVTEAINVLWSDVSWSEQTIVLSETKNGSVRIVPFGAQTGRRLDMLNRKRLDKVVPWVFEGRYGRPLTRSGALQLVKKHFRQFGIMGISPHDLRHSMATAFMDANPDGEATLQVVGGWRSRTMPARYSRLGSDKRAREDFRRRSPTSML